MSVSGAVATARIASAASPRGRERGTWPVAARRKQTWASRNSAGPPNARIVNPSVASPGWAIASSVADGDPDQPEHHQRQRHVPHHPTAPASSASLATSMPIASACWK
jgi:hypothetical protein